MKAARLHEYHQALKLDSVDEPKATGPFDVVVKIGAAGLCRTDLHIQEGQWAEKSEVVLPYTPGHENAGWVHEVGSGVTNVEVGDTVIVHPFISCGLCTPCRRGDDMHCVNGSFPGINRDGGFAELLGGGYAGELSPKASDYVDAILESVERLSKLINDVLDLTTGDARGVVLEKERVDLAGLCRAAVETVRPRAAEKSQKLDVEINAGVGHVFGDARRLRESIEHVLQNAIAYTDAKGRVSLTADGDKKQALISIADNGPGISEEDLPRVFDRFDRVAEAGVRGEAALGLGLPLTRQFVEAHGGSVAIDSERGKGTTVSLSIPRGSR